MPSLPLSSTHGQTTSRVACHNRIWAAQKVERCQVWHDIIAIGQHTRSNDVGRGMTSPPLENTHGRQRWAWNDITALTQHTQSSDVGCGMPSLPFGNTHSRTTSGVACHHHFWAAQTVERRQAWHAIIAFGQHTRSNNVGHDMTSPPLDCTHSRTTSGVA